MSYLSLLIHDITVSNPVETSTADRYGNPVPAVEVAQEKARVEPVTSSEALIDRDTRQTRFRVFLTAATAVTGLSTLTWLTRTLRVDGEPRQVYDGEGLHHHECDCEEIRG